ncbi:hypothetical protein [Chrysodeixis includens nucleopolyhedrovirus]|uniref:Uncharacterized protein n=1 Tax=Chrysodeixis includens nucleopolyhedrovirus TaxID=1207438 RepID=A0A1C8ZY52_9ABAC|nr:hypothetical protein [Chrysodeixis includens nucleopolyhedrovirus]AOL56897.1 hypothetical protein [Chrysodeixis includens nucleopolyhedrovirus]
MQVLDGNLKRKREDYNVEDHDWLRTEIIKTKLLFLKEGSEMEWHEEISDFHDKLITDIYDNNIIDDIISDEIIIDEFDEIVVDDEANIEEINVDDYKDKSEEARQAYAKFYNKHLLSDVINRMDVQGIGLTEVLIDLAYQSKLSVNNIKESYKQALIRENELRKIIDDLYKIDKLTIDDKKSKDKTNAKLKQDTKD